MPNHIDCIPIKFTRASVKDKNIVTVTLSQLKSELTSNLRLNDYFVIVVKLNRQDIPILFSVNRENKTAATRSWPAVLDQPEVASPVVYEVNCCWIVDIEAIYTRSSVL